MDRMARPWLPGQRQLSIPGPGSRCRSPRLIIRMISMVPGWPAPGCGTTRRAQPSMNLGARWPRMPSVNRPLHAGELLERHRRHGEHGRGARAQLHDRRAQPDRGRLRGEVAELSECAVRNPTSRRPRRRATPSRSASRTNSTAPAEDAEASTASRSVRIGAGPADASGIRSVVIVSAIPPAP